MPLPLETTPITPNAVYAPQVLLQTGVINGKIVTSAQIVLGTGYVDQEGNWTITSGQNGTVYIPDVENLDPDIAALSPNVLQIMGGIIQLIGSLNSIRKIV